MLQLLKYWPTDGCIRIGWAGKAYSSLPQGSAFHRQLNRTMLWTLGNPGRFYVRIGDYFGTDTGAARSIAEVYLKQEGSDLDLVHPCIPLQNPDDIIGVVEFLNEWYAKRDSAEAKEWRECMSGFDKELQEAQATEYRYEPDGDLRSDEIPMFVQDAVQDWRYTVVDDNSPDSLLEAFIRMERSWMAYSSCVLANQFGDIYSEELERSDRVGFVLDRKLHQTKDTDRLTWLMNLYNMMMPCYIGTYEEIEKNNVKFQKDWDKAVAQDILDESKPLNASKVELLLRVRDANKRIPAPISKFIKTAIPKYLTDERARLDALAANDEADVCGEIRWLDNYKYARMVMGKDIPDMKEKADQVQNRLRDLMENEDDIHVLDLYSKLLTNRFGYDSAVEERDRLCDRVAEKLKTIIRTPDTRPSKAMDGNEIAVKALVEEFTLAAIYLEIMYLKKEEQDIDYYYWSLHEQNEYEDRLEKESGRNLDFLFW